MTHLERYTSFGPVYLAPWSIENLRASRKLAKWSDYCESCEVGVAIPGLDQTLIMWALRKALRRTGVDVYYNAHFVGVDFYRRELRKLVPKPPALYFDPNPDAFNQPVIEVVVPEIYFHYRFDDAFSGQELQFAYHIIGVLKGVYENNLEI